jgi:hypothetical protein
LYNNHIDSNKQEQMMNERIDELISQCIAHRRTVTGPMFDKEKFAELIVRECMALHDETIAEYRKRRKVADDLVYKDVYAEGEAACVRTRAKIKKHFGVE